MKLTIEKGWKMCDCWWCHEIHCRTEWPSHEDDTSVDPSYRDNKPLQICCGLDFLFTSDHPAYSKQNVRDVIVDMAKFLLEHPRLKGVDKDFIQRQFWYKYPEYFQCPEPIRFLCFAHTRSANAF